MCHHSWIAICVLAVLAVHPSVRAGPTGNPLVPTSQDEMTMVEEFQHENSSRSQLEEEGNVYWIKRRSPDVTLLYVTVPIAAGILLMVLVFFLWIFSSKPESLVQDQFQYEHLNEEASDEVGGGPASHPQPPSPTHPVVDQIFDIPYTGPTDWAEQEEGPPLPPLV